MGCSMVKLSIAAEGLFGLTWPQWKQLVDTVEGLGFHGLYISDHFILPEPPDYPSLEMIVALTYLAAHTERVRFGPRVSPFTYRDPVMLARQAALDDLSGGRMSLGVGAGWMEREHDMFGYDLGDIPERFDRFEEGLEVATRLLRFDEPVSFEGRFYQLRDAVLPAPRRPSGPPIVIGGIGPKRTMPLVARFADDWNIGNLSPDQFAERAAMLDEMIVAAGRRPEDVSRTLNTPVVAPRQRSSRPTWRTAQRTGPARDSRCSSRRRSAPRVASCVSGRCRRSRWVGRSGAAARAGRHPVAGRTVPRNSLARRSGAGGWPPRALPRSGRTAPGCHRGRIRTCRARAPSSRPPRRGSCGRR